MESEDIFLGRAEVLEGTLLQHYWRNIAAPSCGTSKLLLFALARKLMENFEFRHTWICTLDLPLFNHIISQMKWFKLPSQYNAGWKIWTKFRNP